MRLTIEDMNIIVAILNKDHAHQLKQCLDSLLNQNFKNFKVVVVDGGSKDDSLLILKQYSNRDKRIHCFVQKSRGTGMARNELVAYVRDHFPNAQKIVWGDSENVYDSNYLQNIVAVNADVVGGVNIINSENPLSQSLWWYYNGWRGRAISGNNECVNIRVYEKNQYVDVVRGDDFIFHRELTKQGYKLVHCPNAICYIRTMESLGDFIKWTRIKAFGLFQWFSREGLVFSVLRRYLFFNLFIWIYIIFFAAVLTPPFLLVPYFLPPFMLSIYFWQKGKLYVKRMRKATFFYFIPVLLLHFSVTFFELLKLSILKRSLPGRSS